MIVHHKCEPDIWGEVGEHDTEKKENGRTLPEKPGIGGGLKETCLRPLLPFSLALPYSFSLCDLRSKLGVRERKSRNFKTPLKTE